MPRQLFYFVEFVGVTAVLSGVIVAHLKRRDLAGSPFETHMISAVRTFWIGLLAFLVGLGLLLLIYWPAGIAFIYVAPPVLAVWLLFRSIRGLIRAVDGRPIDNPAGFL
ncbi:MAG: hypothetical protein WAN86_11590 [Hyphomicrobiaceae bacterium]